ncbi:PDZ domain-containing protein [Candidatus Woesearchaeota archaeon]|nr:PDZ domain-containing protein [Candidatus Woesearchaeota archaeon]
MDVNLISAIIFYSIIFIIIYLYRKKFEIHGIIALYKTNIGLKLMDRIAKRFSGSLRVLSSMGIYICFIGMLFITGFLLKGIYNLLFIPDSDPVISLVVPGIKIPGFIYVPFWYGIISLFIVVIIHEFSHGVIARLHNTKVNSSGIGMFAIIPLAFVEPDEKQLSKKTAKQQLSVFSAGPFSNILTAIVVLIISLFVISPLAGSAFEFDGIEIEDVVEGAPAEKAGIKKGDIITAIDGVEINRTNINSLLSSKDPGDDVVFQTPEKKITVNPIAGKEDGIKTYYGIFMSSNTKVKDSVVSTYGKTIPVSLLYLLQFLNWLFILSLGIGLANLLPLGPVDGGRMTLTSLKRFFSEEKAARLWKLLSLFILLLLIINILFPFLKKLIYPSL